MFVKHKIKKINSAKIEAAIEDFEKAVDFEFIPVIARRSSYVEHISWVISLMLIGVFISLIDFLFATCFHDSWMSKTPFYIAVPFLAVFLGILLDKSDYVDRFFITHKERKRQVHEKAELIFYKQRLHELKSHNALMLYISVMERQIVLFHDPRTKFENMAQINQQLLEILQKSFKENDYETGLLNAIEQLKKSLMPHFSKSTEVQNIVPNKLIWWHD